MSSDEPGARRASCPGPGSCQHLALNKAGKSRSEPPLQPRAARICRGCRRHEAQVGAAWLRALEPSGAPSPLLTELSARFWPHRLHSADSRGPEGPCPALRQHVLLRERGSGVCGSARTCTRAGAADGAEERFILGSSWLTQETLFIIFLASGVLLQRIMA